MEEQGYFLYYENISDNFTLVQLMYSLGNVNHAASVIEKWIFDSNHENPLPLNI